MDIRVLGPVVVEEDGTSIDIDSPKERAALVALALDPGRTVSTSRLIESLWGSSPPDTAEKTLQWHISRLRKAIGTETLVTESPGYCLHASESDIDAHAFEGGIREGSTLLSDSRPAEALRVLEGALALWLKISLDW